MSESHSHVQCLVKMDPDIWSKLPIDLLELVANMCDIDSRRALGFKPRRLILPVDFVPRPMAPTEYRYYTSTKTLWYFEMSEYMNFYFEVLTDIDVVNYETPTFRYGGTTHERRVTFTPEQTEEIDSPFYIPNWVSQTFQTAGHPIWIA